MSVAARCLLVVRRLRLGLVALTALFTSGLTLTAPQSLTLPADLPQAFQVAVEWDGSIRILLLERHTLRDSAFRVRAYLNDGSLIEVPAPEPATYRGSIAGDPEASVVAQLTDEGLNARIVDPGGQSWTIEPQAGEVRTGAKVRHRVSAEESTSDAWLRGGCSAEPPPLPGGTPRWTPPNSAAWGGATTAGTSGQHLAQIAFDVDHDYYLLKGGSVANSIAAVEAIMNQVDFFYARDVLITYTITEIIVRTTQFYFPTGGGDLLDQFRAEWNSNQSHVVRDLAHLMTDKNNIEFGGLAWVGVVCTDSAYGWSLDGANIVGHEVGHNWGAGHCHDATPCNNMCGACFYVAPRTKEIITAFRDSRTCLDEVGPYGSPLPPYAHPESAELTRDDLAAQAERRFDVLSNDHDGNLDPLSIDDFQSVSEHGAGVTLSPGSGGDGRDELVYSAGGEVFIGDDRFEYTVGDGTGLQTIGEVKLHVLAPGLAGYWKLDDGVGAVAADASGGYRPGAISGSAEWITAPNGGGLSFDGVDDAVTVPSLNRELRSTTITAWLRRDGPQSPFSGIVFSRGGSTVAGLHFGSANELRYTWNDDPASYNWTSGLVVPDGAWVFVALVVESGQATIYLHDGAEMLSSVNPLPHAPEEFDGEIMLGLDSSSGARRLGGALDDVRIYDHALTATEITELRQFGGKAHAPDPADGGRLLPSIGELTWGAGLGAQSHHVYFGTDYLGVRQATPASVEYRGNQVATAFAPRAPLSPGLTYYWRVDEVSGADVVRGDVWLFSIGPPAAHWKLDESSGAIAHDAAGDFDGSYVGGPSLDQEPARPGLGRSVAFDGIDDHVAAPPLGLHSDSVTLSAWVRRDGSQAAFAGLLFSRGGSTVAGLNLGSSNELRYHWNDGQWDWDSGLGLPNQEWVLVVLVLEPTRATVFLGYRDALFSASNYVLHGSEEFDGSFQIARDPTGGRHFKGQIDDVRVYNHALTAAEVAELYLSPGLAAGGVPDGHAVPGPQLRLDRLGDGDVQLNWSPSCVGSDSDYAAYEGALGDFGGHLPATCGTGGMTTLGLSPQPGDRYFLVVPQSTNREGGYGKDSAGNDRLQSSAPCRRQYLSTCD